MSLWLHKKLPQKELFLHPIFKNSNFYWPQESKNFGSSKYFLDTMTFHRNENRGMTKCLKTKCRKPSWLLPKLDNMITPIIKLVYALIS